MVPDEALAVMRMAVNAQHPVSQRFKVGNHFCPAMAVVPVLRLVGGLRGDADIWLSNFPFCIQLQAGRAFTRVNSQDVASITVEADLPEIYRLMCGITLKEKAYIPDA